MKNAKVKCIKLLLFAFMREPAILSEILNQNAPKQHKLAQNNPKIARLKRECNQPKITQNGWTNLNQIGLKQDDADMHRLVYNDDDDDSFVTSQPHLPTPTEANLHAQALTQY